MSSTPNAVGGRLREAREAAGMSVDDAMVALRQLLPEPYWITSSSISRIERDVISPTKLDVAFLTGLCEAYGRNLIDVLPEYADAHANVVDLLQRNRARKYTLERRKERRAPKGGSRVVTHLPTDGYPARRATAWAVPLLQIA